MKLKGQMGECPCPRRFLKFLRKIRTAVAFTRSVFLHRPRFIHANKYFIFQICILVKVCRFAISLFRFVISWFRGLQTALPCCLNHLAVCFQDNILKCEIIMCIHFPQNLENSPGENEALNTI